MKWQMRELYLVRKVTSDKQTSGLKMQQGCFHVIQKSIKHHSDDSNFDQTQPTHCIHKTVVNHDIE